MCMQSKKSIIYWTFFFLLGIYVVIFDELFFYYSFVFILFATIIFFFINRNLSEYLAFSICFFFIGGLTVWTDLSNRSKLSEGDKTYLGEILEVNKKEIWSSLKIKIHGFYEGNNSKWNKKNYGENVILILPTRHVNPLNYLDKIVFSSSFSKIKNKHNPGEFNAESYYLSKDILYNGFLSSDSVCKINSKSTAFIIPKLNEMAAWSSEKIQLYVKDTEASIIIGMLLGDQSSIDKETKQSFINTGSSHMLAVSGAHIAIITALLIGFLSKIGVNTRGWGAAIFLLSFLWSYALLTGFSASVVRAVMMFSIFIIVRLLYRPANNVLVLSLSALLITAFNWNSALDVGFQLSYAAMLGIFIVYPKLIHWFKPNNKWMKWIWEGTVLCLAAQVFTTPLALYHFHQFPNYFLFSNFLIMLAAGPMMIGGILLLLLSWIPILNVFIGKSLSWVTYLFISCLNGLNDLPFSVAYGYSLSLTILILAILSLTFLLFTKRKWKFVLSLTIFMVLISYKRWENYSREGLLFFNTNGTTFLVKNKKEALLFTSDYSSAVNKGNRLIEDFTKVYPCTYSFQTLPKIGEKIFVNQDVVIEGVDGYYKLNYRNKLYYLIYNPKKYIAEKHTLTNGDVISFEQIETITDARTTSKSAFWL